MTTKKRGHVPKKHQEDVNSIISQMGSYTVKTKRTPKGSNSDIFILDRYGNAHIVQLKENFVHHLEFQTDGEIVTDEKIENTEEAMFMYMTISSILLDYETLNKLFVLMEENNFSIRASAL